MSAFVEIIRCGSLAAAAERLGQSPSMVAKHLNALEAHLGVRLLQRTTRRQQLTEAGSLYLERCHDILGRLEAADDDASSLQRTPTGQLRISAPISFGTTQLSAVIALYLAKHPSINIELTLTDAPIDLIDSNVDIAFRIGPLQDSSYVARSLPSFYTMVVCAAPAYLNRRGVPRIPEDLLHHQCLGHTRWGPQHAWRFNGPVGPIEVAVNYRLRVDQGPALREAALAGAGVILQPHSLVHDDLIAGRLVRLLESYTTQGRDLYLLYARDVTAPAKVKSFVDFTLRHFSVASH